MPTQPPESETLSSYITWALGTAYALLATLFGAVFTQARQTRKDAEMTAIQVKEDVAKAAALAREDIERRFLDIERRFDSSQAERHEMREEMRQFHQTAAEQHRRLSERIEGVALQTRLETKADLHTLKNDIAAMLRVPRTE